MGTPGDEWGTKRGAVALQRHGSRAGQDAYSHCWAQGCRVSAGDQQRAVPHNCLVPELEGALGGHPGHRNWHPETSGVYPRHTVSWFSLLQSKSPALAKLTDLDEVEARGPVFWPLPRPPHP